jgi:diacylglycerol kinase family enzyme
VGTRVHLLVNEASGTGHDASVVSGMRRILERAFPHVTASVVSDHPGAAAEARRLASDSGPPSTIFVGGGGGTLRGVIEGIAATSEGNGLPGSDRVRIAALRMGSGNLLAKQLGVPKDPLRGMERLVEALRAERFTACCMGRYDFEREGGSVETRYAAGLAGFGQLGRVPGDLERWRKGFPRLRRRIAGLFGLERWNDVEYAVATLLRSARAAIAPRSVERVELRSGDGDVVVVEELHLLAGVVMNFPVPNLPFDPGTSLDVETLTAYFVPFRGRTQAASLVLAPRAHARSALRLEVLPGRTLEIRLCDRERVEMFLDEDPIELYRKMTVSVPGSLTFVDAR